MVAEVVCLIWTGQPDIERCCIGNHGPAPPAEPMECNTVRCLPPVAESITLNVSQTVTSEADAMNKRDLATTLISNVTVMPEEALDMQVAYSTDKRLSLTFADSADETEQIDRINQALMSFQLDSSNTSTVALRRSLSSCISFAVSSGNFTDVYSILSPAYFLTALGASLGENATILDCGSSGQLVMDIYYSAHAFGENSTFESSMNNAAAVLESNGYTVVLSNVTSSSSDENCQDGWLKSEYYCYQYVSTTRTWPNAQGVCNNRGAILIEIQTVEQNNVARALCPKTEYCWLGGEISSWASGEPYGMTIFDFESNIQSNSSCTSIFCHSSANYLPGYDKLLMFSKNGTWQFFPNSTYLPFICMKPTISFGDWNDWGACTVDCGSGWRTRSRSCSTGRDEDCAQITSIFSSDYGVCNTGQCTTTTTTASLATVFAVGELLNFEVEPQSETVIRLEGVQNQYAHFQVTVTPLGVMVNTLLNFYIDGIPTWSNSWYGVMSASDNVVHFETSQYMNSNEFTVKFNHTMIFDSAIQDFQVVFTRIGIMRQESIAAQCASASDAHLLQWPTLLNINQIGFLTTPNILHFALTFPRRYFNISIAFNGTGMCDFDESRIYSPSPRGLNETYWHPPSLPSDICTDVTYEADIPWTKFAYDGGGGVQTVNTFANKSHLGFVMTVTAIESVSTSMNRFNDTSEGRSWALSRTSTWRYPLLVSFQRQISFTTSVDVYICGGNSDCTIINAAALIAYKRQHATLYEFDIITKTQYPYMMNSSVIPSVEFIPNGHSSEVNVSIAFVSEKNCNYTDAVDLSAWTVPACTQYWTLSVDVPEAACSISGDYIVTWEADCFYKKPTCYFMVNKGVTYNSQTASFSIVSEDMCPDLVHDIDLSGYMCDTGSINFDACLANSRYDSGIDAYFRTTVSSNLGAINFTRIVGVSIEVDYSNVLALNPSVRPYYDLTFQNAVLYDAFNPGPVTFSDELSRQDETFVDLVKTYDSVATGSPFSAAFRVKLHNFLVPVLHDGMEYVTFSAIVETHYEGVSRRQLQQAQDLVFTHRINMGRAMKCRGVVTGETIFDNVVFLSILVLPAEHFVFKTLIHELHSYIPPSHIKLETDHTTDDGFVSAQFSVTQDSSFTLTINLLHDIVFSVNSGEQSFCIQSTQINEFSRAVVPGALIAVEKNASLAAYTFITICLIFLMWL